MSRRERFTIEEVRGSYEKSVAQLASLESEVKKKCIRAMLDQKEIERQQSMVRSLQQQLDELRLSKATREACFGTEDQENTFIRTKDDPESTHLFNTQILTLTPEDGFYGKRCCSCRQ
jgi:hypothetical protein